MCEEEKDYLRRTEFFTALKAISIYQNYKSLTDYHKLIDSSKLPLPNLSFNQNDSPIKKSEESKAKSFVREEESFEEDYFSST